MARARGERIPHVRLRAKAETTKSAARQKVNTPTSARDRRPVGSSRPAVLGFWASRSWSARRLNPIAAFRAQTIAATIQNTCPGVIPCPTAASTAPDTAKGRAKTLWGNFTIRPHVRTVVARLRASTGSLPERTPTLLQPRVRYTLPMQALERYFSFLLSFD